MERSCCCNAKVKVVGKTTLHYECKKCGCGCDVFYTQRKTWKINPKTRIRLNKKKKNWGKLTKKEIEHYRKWEDF